MFIKYIVNVKRPLLSIVVAELLNLNKPGDKMIYFTDGVEMEFAQQSIRRPRANRVKTFIFGCRFCDLYVYQSSECMLRRSFYRRKFDLLFCIIVSMQIMQCSYTHSGPLGGA